MSLDSTTSQIVEQVRADLLTEDNMFVIERLDSAGGGIEFETPVKIDNPFNFDPARFLPNCQQMTLPRFIEVTNDLMADAQSRDGTVETARAQLVEEYPAERFDRFGDEVVAWKLISREPANMDPSATGRKQRGYTHHYRLRSPENPNKWIDVEARPLDHIVEFQCWSKSARLANQRALWLEKLLINHEWAYQVQGADRLFFKRRLNDWYTTVSGQGLYVRPLQFFVRLWDFRTTLKPVIQQITFEIGSRVESELPKGF